MNGCRSRFAVVSASFALLSACTSLDLATDHTALTDAERNIARTITELTAARCVRSSYRVDTAHPAVSTTKITSRAIVKRLYSSPDTSWYRAEVVNAGTWDNVYYHRRSGHLVCGEKTWGAWADVRTVTFTEIKPAPNS